MGRRIGRLLAALLAAGALLAATAGDGRAYVGVKGGLFVPNDDALGLAAFENGLAAELFLGGDVGPVSIELGIGGYTAEVEGGGDSLDTGYAAGTGKLYLPLGPLALYGGGGAGYYFSKERDGDLDGRGPGIHLVGGAEFSLGLVSLLAELRWSRVKLEFLEGAPKENVGGLVAAIGVIF